MTKLVVLPEGDAETTVLTTTEPAEISRVLADVGVRFEQWAASAPLASGASQEAVLAAYRADVERLSAEGGYGTVDVVGLHGDPADPAWPAKAADARGKFLAEHTHADDEVRFFVDGRGAFYLRLAGQVHIVCCEAGDLLSVPAGTRHWFDMGTNPGFVAIRFFREPEGWVGQFTQNDIATRFPAFDDLVAPVAG